MWEQVVGILLDISLGCIALKLVLSLERNQKQQSALLAHVTKRVDRLEDRMENGVNSYPVGPPLGIGN